MQRNVGLAVLDVGIARQLRGMPGRDGSLFDDLAPIFGTTTTAQLGRIETCLAAEEPQLAIAAAAAVQLADACASFGAARMAAASRSLATVLGQAGGAPTAEALARLRSEHDAVLAQLALWQAATPS